MKKQSKVTIKLRWKASKLAEWLTEEEITGLLDDKRHVHRNPTKAITKLEGAENE